MLTIVVPGEETFDETTSSFCTVGDITLELEHSLVSLSKWESIYEKPFLGAGEKSDEEVMDYVRCMILSPDFPPEVFSKFTQANIDAVNAYINKPSTATWFASDPNGRKSAEVITSELIYYWLTVFNIPFECQHWHLNRLFTFIRVCNVKNQKPKKQTRAEMLAQRNQLNAERKARYKTSG